MQLTLLAYTQQATGFPHVVTGESSITITDNFKGQTMPSDDLMPEHFANAQVSMEALHAAQCVILLSLSTDTTTAELHKQVQAEQS